MNDLQQLTERYTVVQERITRAAQAANRNPAEITLVAVTKTWPVATIQAAYQVGMRHFGENRAEELAEKRPYFAAYPDITWHLIGTLQSRKSRLAAAHADLFHALDRLKIVARLNQQRPEFSSQPLPAFLEVNLSGEESKSGFMATQWETDATQQATLRTIVESAMALPHVRLVGLMTIAPWEAPREEIRRVFRRTRELAAWLETAVAHLSLPYLSMGMTDDFELAIAEGATHIRVGRAIFGERMTL